MRYLKKDLLPIETERLLLRLPEPEEAGLMVKYVTENRDHLGPWEPVRGESYYWPDTWDRELRARQAQFYSGTAVRLAIFLKDQPAGPILGVCNFTDILRGVFQACYLGYSTHHKYQGRGIMFEALQASCRFMFDIVKLHRIMANYIPRNERSGKLLRGLGFNVEGYAYDYLKINGKWEDHILTSLIKTSPKKENQ